MDYEASDIVKKILQVKEFIKLRVQNRKDIISRPIKRRDNDSASRVVMELLHEISNCAIPK